MQKNIEYNISIVLYNSNFDQISNIIRRLQTLERLNEIYIVDNSKNRDDRFENLNVSYDFVGKNIGFGAGHNRSLKKSVDSEIPFHFVINYDIDFEINVFDNLFNYIKQNPSVGLIMPKVLNTDGGVQFLPKLIPTPLDVLVRSFRLRNDYFKSRLERYCMINYQGEVLEIPIISGCFSLFRTEVLKEIGYYDERFFLYFEDFDLSRRISEKYKTIVLTSSYINHEHGNGGRKNLKLFFVFIMSFIRYFKKWGWVIDRQRNILNNKALSQNN
jgi:hypothetical protein